MVYLFIFVVALLILHAPDMVVGSAALVPAFHNPTSVPDYTCPIRWDLNNRSGMGGIVAAPGNAITEARITGWIAAVTGADPAKRGSGCSGTRICKVKPRFCHTED